ncbi:hypothetical protein ABMY20_15450 [Tenacibaculum sp. SSH1-16]|uniref:hypothetical protein n=1 Tax=Tenacibaculum sp. SSH1-16 TaxID=3136667 RepID=UPI0032C3FB57
MFKNEREIAKKAEQMLETSLRSKTASFANHVNNTNTPSLKEATAKARLKKYGLVRAGTAKYYMRSLSIKMARHGFIQHYGVDTIREAGKRTRHKPKETTYRFKHHIMNMKPKPFINKAVEDSNVIEFVTTNIAKHRSEEVLINITGIIGD